MVLLHTGRRGAGGGLSPVGRAAAVLAAFGVLLPLSPLGPPLGMTALPLSYYAQLAAVLTLYAAALAMAMRRLERRHAEREA
ncbi:Mg2+-importing ATPase [Streptomyces sp. MnatMP-M27]|nr:Mg2+-importing ATPase [Streptomyces sp. MnatMP-M27]